MKLTSNTKILRKILILCVLTVGLMFVASNEATPVSAKSCFDATNDFYGALDVYDAAFYSYYYDYPTSCGSSVCAQFQPGTPERQQCEQQCQQDRHTDLNNALIGITQARAAVNTCTNPPPDRCANAAAMASDCQIRYDYLQYSDLNQRLEVFGVYSECVNASGISSCQ